MKRIENDFLAVEKFCPWLKCHFPFISQANMYFLAFFPTKKNFVRADGQGITMILQRLRVNHSSSNWSQL